MRILAPLIFFGLAALFAVDPLPGRPAVSGTPAFDEAAIDPAPPRQAIGEPPTTSIGGIRQRCSDCHEGFPARDVPAAELLQHRELVHDHGMNDRCGNCHDQRDHDRLVLHDGSTIGYDHVELLCAKCHGTAFRDWQRGTHGRTSGSWDAASGRQSRLGCVECHDPHAPRQMQVAPLPGPHTFRMGDPEPRPVDHAAEERNPLRRQQRGSGGGA